jgi:hypothetical protein
MKRFKQFLEEHLLKQSLLEYGPPNPPSQYIPQPGGSDSDNYWVPGNYSFPGAGNPNELLIRDMFGIPGRNPGASERLPFFLYNDNGDIIGSDFNGDGEADTPEQLEQWAQNGLPPSEWLVDQPWYERFFYFFWNIGQWVVPFGGWTKVIGFWTKIASVIDRIAFTVFGIADIYDILRLLSNIFSGDFNDLPANLLQFQAQLQQIRNEFLSWLIENGFSSFIDLLSQWGESWASLFDDNAAGRIPKMFYKLIDGNYANFDPNIIKIQLYRFNPNTGTWEPYGEPITLQEYMDRCAGGESNCPPIDTGQIPFTPPIPDPVIPNFVDEPLDLDKYRQYPTNNHWNQQAPGGGSGILNDPPNPNIFQL